MLDNRLLIDFRVRIKETKEYMSFQDSIKYLLSLLGVALTEYSYRLMRVIECRVFVSAIASY